MYYRDIVYRDKTFYIIANFRDITFSIIAQHYCEIFIAVGMCTKLMCYFCCYVSL